MQEKQTTNRQEHNAFSWLLLLFIALKLCGVIDWSWWWVLSPLWGTAVFAAVMAMICLGLEVVARRNSRTLRRSRRG